jgi:long-chain acyl-CoA synthetase
MKTIIELFETAIAKFPDNIYLWEKRNGKYEGTSYKETREQVLNLAAGFGS